MDGGTKKIKGLPNQHFFELDKTIVSSPAKLILDNIDGSSFYPEFDQYLMAVLLKPTQCLTFDPGYPIFQNERLEFSLSFWFKPFKQETNDFTFLRNKNFVNFRFLNVICFEFLENLYYFFVDSSYSNNGHH